MRAALVIVLVGGLSSAASGTISLYAYNSPLDSDTAVAVGDTLTVQVHSDSISPWEGYLILEEWGWGPASLTNPATYPAA